MSDSENSMINTCLVSQFQYLNSDSGTLLLLRYLKDRPPCTAPNSISRDMLGSCPNALVR